MIFNASSSADSLSSPYYKSIRLHLLMYHSNQSGIPNMLYIINNCIAHISINTIIILSKSGITNHQLLTFHQYLTNVFFIILLNFIYILNCFFNLLSCLFNSDLNTSFFHISNLYLLILTQVDNLVYTE